MTEYGGNAYDGTGEPFVERAMRALEKRKAGEIGHDEMLSMIYGRELTPEELERFREDAGREERSWSQAAPVFAPEFDEEEQYPNGDKLPGLWITAPIQDREGNPAGRNCIYLYSPAFDPGGEDALYYGGCYYDEGMGYTDPADRGKRLDCFRAAELLYRHSAGKGNAVANLCLGYVYSYDRCEGNYWVDPLTLDTAEDYERPYPREERAFECLSAAAEAGIPEACYKLGDLYKHGTGCEPSAAEAFRWYVRASELAVRERPVILGSVALRLAGCYEEGLGCEQSFERALEWYKKAVSGLEFAVEAGETWYGKALSGARAGAKRCQQEMTP